MLSSLNKILKSLLWDERWPKTWWTFYSVYVSLMWCCSDRRFVGDFRAEQDFSKPDFLGFGIDIITWALCWYEVERDIFLKLIMNGNHYICKSLLLHSITEQRLWKSWKVKEGETHSWTFLICPTDFRVFIIPKTHLPNLSYLYTFCTESPPLFLLEGGGGDICPGPCRNQA